MTDERFAYAVGVVLDNEGGYTNDPDDPGGETNFGISKAANPDVDIKNLTVPKAVSIYKTRYWDATGIGALPVSDRGFSAKLFDTAVSIGCVRAVKIMQRALAACGCYATGTDLKTADDGKAGVQTLAALKQARDFRALQCAYNADLAAWRRMSGRDSKFLEGWLRRAAKIY